MKIAICIPPFGDRVVVTNIDADISPGSYVDRHLQCNIISVLLYNTEKRAEYMVCYSIIEHDVKHPFISIGSFNIVDHDRFKQRVALLKCELIDGRLKWIQELIAWPVNAPGIAQGNIVLFIHGIPDKQGREQLSIIS